MIKFYFWANPYGALPWLEMGSLLVNGGMVPQISRSGGLDTELSKKKKLYFASRLCS